MTRKTLKVHCRADGGTAGFEMRAPWPYCDTPRAYTEHVSRDAFAWLPEDVQCRRCAVLGGIASGTHEHLMAVELLVAMLQRLWAARLEVGHRCYPCPWGYCVCGKRTPVACVDCGETICVKPWWQHVADTRGKWRDCATSEMDARQAFASAKLLCEMRQLERRAGEP